MNGAQRELEAKAVMELYAAKGWDSSRVVAYILNKPDPTAEMGMGVQMIEVERAAQLLREGFTPRHDDEHARGELAQAGACYATIASYQIRTGSRALGDPPLFWPWELQWWKPSQDKIKNLKRAGALIASEIDRLVRLAERDGVSRIDRVQVERDTARAELEKLKAVMKADADAKTPPSAGKGGAS